MVFRITEQNELNLFVLFPFLETVDIINCIFNKTDFFLKKSLKN